MQISWIDATDTPQTATNTTGRHATMYIRNTGKSVTYSLFLHQTAPKKLTDGQYFCFGFTDDNRIFVTHETSVGVPFKGCAIKQKSGRKIGIHSKQLVYRIAQRALKQLHENGDTTTRPLSTKQLDKVTNLKLHFTIIELKDVPMRTWELKPVMAPSAPRIQFM